MPGSPGAMLHLGASVSTDVANGAGNDMVCPVPRVGLAASTTGNIANSIDIDR